ncbi:MAG: GNAT family N-acetyltransferase [Phycisphaerae bacterium]|nr:GNAT family N-acetyltransferase [Phycisphaerae bacterium]
MIPTTTIRVDGKTVTLRLMDESWLINQCAGAHPFKPRPGVVWQAHERCARLPEIAGDEFPNMLRRLRDTYGHCAAIAWHDERVLGHLVWMPRHEARTLRAKGFECFGPAADDATGAGDAGTLVVVNLAFCSLSGHGFRRKGVGRAMVDMMLAWAWEHGWRRIEAYDVTGGLFPWDWLDACIPPRPFWEHMGFAVFGQRLHAYTEEELDGLLADNPRHDDREQEEKRSIVARVRAGQVDEALMGHFDLRLVLAEKPPENGIDADEYRAENKAK